MTLGTGLGAIVLLVGRILFGGMLALSGLAHFGNASEMTEMTQLKGVPAPGFGVVVSGMMLVLGGLGILLGVYPIIAAGMLTGFFLVVTPVMHDFWAAPEDQQQLQMIHFMKNVYLLGPR